MPAVSTISKILSSTVLSDELTIVPTSGASEEEIAAEEAILERQLSARHRALLEEWNGIDLEVVIFFGCGPNAGEVGRLADFKIDFNLGIKEPLVIGSDASGFVYLEANDGRIYCLNTDGRDVEEFALDFDDFVDRVVFGDDAEQFAGDEWLQELRHNGLL